MDILSIIASGAVGVVIALIVQLWWESRTTLRQMKLDCLRRIAGNRSGPPTKEFAAALNEVFVTFNKSPDVVEKMKTFLRAANTRTTTDDHLLEVIKSMMDDLGLKYKNISDSDMLTKINGN
ncbi:MAG: DUF6680 family protein [Rhizomicrobium sp.]